jgi:DNA polymerase-3 subunit delta'
MSHSLSALSLPSQLADLAHAYIMEGTDIGLSEQLALDLAQGLLCQNNQVQVQSGCGQCHSCQLFSAHNHPDLFATDTEQNSVGVDEVRSISEFLNKTAQLSGNQVIIINNAQTMTENASNALLKTLEEPSGKSYILLLCQHKSQLLPTIISRCQVLTIANKTKSELQDMFPDMPSYLVGFSQGSASKLMTWQESDKAETFKQVYDAFILWLKRSQPDFVLVDAITSDKELHEFLLYLFSRRIYQLVSQQNSQGFQAQAILNEHKASVLKIAGLNQGLALSGLLSKLRPII